MGRKSKELEIVERWPRLDDILEGYLGQTQDLRKEPAFIIEADGTHKTLDGSRVRPLREVVSPEKYGIVAKRVRSKKIDGIKVGDQIFVRVMGDN